MLALLVATALAVDPLAPDLEAGAAELIEAAPHARRYRLGEVEVQLLKAPGPDEPPTSPWCTANGADLVVVGQPDEATRERIDAVCARLALDAPSLARDPEVAAARAYVPPAWPEVPAMPPLRVAAALWLLTLIFTLPRQRAVAALVAAGLAVRLTFGHAGIFMGYAYAYERLLMYAGDHPASGLYGGAWPALADVVRPLLGAAPEQLHTWNLLLSLAAVALVFGVVRKATGSDGPAAAAALALATLPQAVVLSRTEDQFVACATLQLAAAWGLLRRDRWGDLLAGLSIGLLAHTRPFQIPAALVLLGAAGAWRRWPAVAIASGLLGVRAVEILAMVGNHGVPSGAGRMVDLGLLLRRQVGPGAATVLLDPWTTPAWIPVGLVVGWREAGRQGWRTARWGALALGLASALPYVHMHRVTDVLRFQLPAVTWWVVLASLSLPAVARWSQWSRVLAAGVVVGTLVVAKEPDRGRMTHQVEHEVFQLATRGLPRDRVVRYDDARDPHGTFARWAQVAVGVQLVPLGDPPLVPGDLVWEGRASRASGRPALERCSGEVLTEAETSPWNAELVDLGTTPVPLRLWRVTACEDATTP